LHFSFFHFLDTRFIFLIVFLQLSFLIFKHFISFCALRNSLLSPWLVSYIYDKSMYILFMLSLLMFPLHTGHCLLYFKHISIQLKWNMCPHKVKANWPLGNTSIHILHRHLSNSASFCAATKSSSSSDITMTSKIWNKVNLFSFERELFCKKQGMDYQWIPDNFWLSRTRTYFKNLLKKN